MQLIKHDSRKLLFSLLLILNATFVKAELTIHVLHPWASDTARLANGLRVLYYQNYYPGTPMTREAGNWFSFTFSEVDSGTNDRFELVSYIKTQYVEFDKSLKYSGGPQQMIFKNILALNPTATELWMYISDTSKVPQILFTPPPGKVIKFFNPWDLGAPQVVLKGSIGTIKMRGVKGLCGWLSYVHLDTTSEPVLRFFNRADSTTYGALGLNDTSFIDFKGLFAKSDTVWILPTPYPEGIPIITEKFPGRVADCPPITLAAKVWDIGKHVDFGGNVTNLTTGIVLNKLGKDGKPVHRQADSTVKSLATWFETQNFPGGYTNERCCNIVLGKNDEVLYEYQTNAFYPIDDFKFLDDAGTIKNPNWADGTGVDYEHNHHFVMEMGCEFEYRKGQTFYFRGDDDVWVFIDSQLVVDIGGIHGPIERSVDLDTLKLVQGKSYSFKLFFAERHCCGSNFKMVTSINLRTSSKLFHTSKTLPDSAIQYDMYEKVTQSSLACDVGEVIDTAKGVVSFYIEGPSFDSAQFLDAGTHWNGVTIPSDFTHVIINEDNITQLLPGIYTIKYYSAKNPGQSGQITFAVTKTPKPVQIINSVTHAAIFADNGYGRADRVEIYFKDTLRKSPDSIIVAWPSLLNRFSFSRTDIIADSINKRHLTVSLGGKFASEITAYTGTDNLGIFYSVDTAFSNPLSVIPFKLCDSIGPLLSSASFSERTVSGPDTFVVQFSEIIIDSSCIGPSLLLIQPGVTCTLTIIKIEAIGNTFRILTNPTTGISVSIGDSLRLNPSGPLKDLFSNHPHRLNRPVALSIRKKPPEIVNAFYRDRNADGSVDEVVVQFDKNVNINSLSSIVSFKQYNSSLINSDRITRSTNNQSTIVIDINNSLSDSIKGSTSGNMNIKINIADFPGYLALSGVRDSAAPVITDAWFYEGVKLSRTSSPFDTLHITFSEDVQSIDYEEPFLFKPPVSSKFSYSLFLMNSGSTGSKHSFLVVNVQGNGYPDKNDSVYINVSGNVKDRFNNSQNASLNHRVLLQTKPATTQIIISAGPSPFNPEKEKLNIIIDPLVKSKNIASISAEIAIFDGLGTLILKHIEQSTGKILFPWNGTNQKGRVVGNGSYLILVKATDQKTNQTRFEQRLIGVNKK
jgi:fibro-slime domain-containing protein